jgi:predicted nuclease of predicted toxin-antitoxin system
MPVTPQAVPHLEAGGHDAVHASKIGLETQADSEILERARAEERIVITADLDYPRLLALLNAERPGLILFRGGSYSDAEMLALLDRVLVRSRAIAPTTSSTRPAGATPRQAPPARRTRPWAARDGKRAAVEGRRVVVEGKRAAHARHESRQARPRQAGPVGPLLTRTPGLQLCSHAAAAAAPC